MTNDTAPAVRAPMPTPSPFAGDLTCAPMSADDWLTVITSACSDHVAAGYVRSIPPATLHVIADQLMIDDAHHAAPWVRAQIVAEARA